MGKTMWIRSYCELHFVLLSLGTIKASEVVVLNEDSVVVNQRKRM